MVTERPIRAGCGGGAPTAPTLLFGTFGWEFSPHSLGGNLGLHPQFQSPTDTLLPPPYFCFSSLIWAGAPPLCLEFPPLEGPSSLLYKMQGTFFSGLGTTHHCLWENPSPLSHHSRLSIYCFTGSPLPQSLATMDHFVSTETNTLTPFPSHPSPQCNAMTTPTSPLPPPTHILFLLLKKLCQISASPGILHESNWPRAHKSFKKS